MAQLLIEKTYRHMDLPALANLAKKKPELLTHMTHHTLPSNLTHALHRLAPFDTEWLTDSLLAFTTPLATHYHSPDPACAAFAARPDPYLSCWQGCGLVHPPHTAPDISRALKWAVLSATTTHTPTLLIFCAPALDPRHAAAKYYRHPSVHRLATQLPIHSPRPFAWTGRSPAGATRSSTVDILLIANDPGITAFLKRHEAPILTSLLEVWAPTTIPVDTAFDNWQQRIQTDTSFPHIPMPKAFLAARQPIPPTLTTHPPHAIASLLPDLPTQRTLRFRQSATRLIYTDGSKNPDTNSLGSGIYSVKAAPNQLVETTLHVTHGPALHPQLNTVPRAEATAILVALQHFGPEEDIVIFTDSLTVIHQLNRALYTPSSQTHHKNGHMLNKIIHTALRRTGTTSIFKVRAHAGVDGNEKADAAAGLAATGDPTAGGTWITYDAADTASPSLGPSWIARPVPAPTAADPDAVEYRAFDELRHQPKAYSTTAYADYVLAKDATTSILRKLNALPAALQAIVTPTDAAPVSIETISITYPLSSTSIQFYDVTSALRVRFNQFRTAQRMSYITNTTSPLCPLCPHEVTTVETVGHYFGGCRHRAKTAIFCKRHGEAVTIIGDAIKEGTLGNCPIFMDAETGDRSARSLPAYIPSQPPGPDRSLPDILLLPRLTNETLATLGPDPIELPPALRHIVLLELGYTQDLHLPTKLQEKLAQHQGFKALLESRGWTVVLAAIPVSYTGLLLSSLRTTLTDCGVTGAAVTATLHRLVSHSISYIGKVRALHNGLLDRSEDDDWDPG